jgi:hypothetical protein
VEKHKGFHDNSPSPLYSENDEKRKKWTVIYRIMHQPLFLQYGLNQKGKTITGFAKFQS